MSSTSRRGWIRCLGVALLPIAAHALAGCGNSEAKNPTSLEKTAESVAVSWAAAEERLVPQTVEVTGALTADAQTDVATQLPGRVVQVMVERGAAVQAGAVLARLDAEDAANQVREAEAIEAQTRERLGLTEGKPFDPADTPDVRQARASMERAEAEFQRYASLMDDGAISRSEYDLKRTDSRTAREQYQSAVNQMRQLYQALLAQRARVGIARKALADMTIRAPFDGLIAEKHATVGQYLDKGGKIATLVRVHPLRVELTVPEAAAAVIRSGQKVSFAVQTYPDRRFQGTVAYVGPALRSDARALVAEALVPNPNGVLQPGLFATASIELPATVSTAFVPAAAVRTEAGVSRLFVLTGGRAEMRFLQIGRRMGDHLEVLRGVRPGERVATEGAERLADGTPVTERPQGGS
jgi:membrane fusion protein, multidrug efflux system